MSWGMVAAAAITTVGGAMGSKGQQGSTSTQQVMDPRMAPYIFGQNGQPGLLSMTQDQLQRSQSPERMQGWDNMMHRGQGLLNGSVAGNPFSGAYSGGSLHGLYQGLLQNSQGRYTPPPLPAPPPAPAPNPQMTPTIDQLMAQYGIGGGLGDSGNQGRY
jgi:hypothetical protein